MLGYRFITSESSLRIEHERIEPVVFALEPFALVVQGPRPVGAASVAPAGDDLARFGLDDVHGAARCILERIAARGWRPPRLPHSILLGHLLAERGRSLERVNPAAHAVTHAVLEVGRKLPRLAGEPSLYDERFVVKDILQYRAAAAALAHLETDLYPRWATRRGVPDAGETPPADALIAAMREWRSLFSPSARDYRSLNRTLMNLPDEVSGDLLCGLARYELEAPVLQRLPLLALLLHLEDRRAAVHPESATLQRRAIARATNADVVAALRRIGSRTERQLRPSRLPDLAFVVRYLIDDPEPYHGSLAGLVHHAIRWHERFLHAEGRGSGAGGSHASPNGRRSGARDPAPHDETGHEAVAAVPASAASSPRTITVRGASRNRSEIATARPPIPLPVIPGVEFLGTVMRVIEEGQRMENCLASYAQSAFAGDCYLFHVDYEGEQATVEIDPSGRVRQAEGPRNTRNRASAWGARRLARWAKQFHGGIAPEDDADSFSDSAPARSSEIERPRQPALFAEIRSLLRR